MSAATLALNTWLERYDASPFEMAARDERYLDEWLELLEHCAAQERPSARDALLRELRCASAPLSFGALRFAIEVYSPNHLHKALRQLFREGRVKRSGEHNAYRYALKGESA